MWSLVDKAAGSFLASCLRSGTCCTGCTLWVSRAVQQPSGLMQTIYSTYDSLPYNAASYILSDFDVESASNFTFLRVTLADMYMNNVLLLDSAGQVECVWHTARQRLVLDSSPSNTGPRPRWARAVSIQLQRNGQRSTTPCAATAIA